MNIALRQRPVEIERGVSGATGKPPVEEATEDGHLAWFVNVAARDSERYRYLLLLRYALLNLVAFAILGAAYFHGLVDLVLSGDSTGLCVVIFLTFLCGLAISTWKVLQTSRELNQIKAYNPLLPSRVGTYIAQLRGRSADSRSMAAMALRLKLSNRISVIRYLANSLVLLGLIGTVIGFIIALSGVDPAQASDARAIAPMVANLIEGMSVALYTTLVGAVFNLWLTANFRLLATGTVNLIADLVERGESRGGT